MYVYVCALDTARERERTRPTGGMEHFGNTTTKGLLGCWLAAARRLVYIYLGSIVRHLIVSLSLSLCCSLSALPPPPQFDLMRLVAMREG